MRNQSHYAQVSQVSVVLQRADAHSRGPIADACATLGATRGESARDLRPHHAHEMMRVRAHA